MLTSAFSALDPDELLTPPQVSQITKLTVSTLADKRWKGTGPAFTKLSPGRGGRIRYRRGDVYTWLARSSQEAKTA